MIQTESAIDNSDQSSTPLDFTSAAAFKVSELIEEENIDHYLELSVLNGVQNEMKSKFEFENIRDLKIETMPMHLILNQIMRNILEVFPTSSLGLEAFQHAISFRE